MATWLLSFNRVASLCALALVCTTLHGCGGGGSSPTPAPTPGPPAIPEYDSSWKSLIAGSDCPTEKSFSPKNGGAACNITCMRSPSGVRQFKFPVGTFDIDEQVVVPASTSIEGNAPPNDPIDKTKDPDPATQTFFVATKGVTDPDTPYCGTDQNMKQGDAQKIRIGFLLNSNTVVKNINFQGKDTTRPLDNGNLCGGGVFETPGCVSPGFGDGPGTDGKAKRNGCFDHAGKSNDLILGDGKGVSNIVIDSVRLNSLLLPSDPSQYVGAPGSQVAVWVAMTQDGSATTNVNVTNVVSMLTRGDGINLHGNVQNSRVENCHVENTGDDIYAFWGAYAENPSNNIFINNVGKNTGATRNYGYGVCVAIYGAKDVTFTGMKCYDRAQKDWNPGQVPKGNEACNNGAYCNSCLAYVHDAWFGAVYPTGNTIRLYGNEYLYMDGTPIPETDRPQIRNDTDKGSKANIITSPTTLFEIV